MTEFAYGDKVLILDAKGRRYLATLKEGGEFHTHAGFFPMPSSSARPRASSSRPTVARRTPCCDPRSRTSWSRCLAARQVIYPKDLGPILVLADIAARVRVLESGVGSGALSMAMLRAGADIVGYELREDFANRARGNVRSFLGADVLERYRVELRDCYDGIDEQHLDRVVLDLPEPWRAPHAAATLRAGGILVAYTPSIIQAAQLREALARTGAWLAARTLEVLHRTWHIEGQAVRPDHRMVAHTGFLTTARLGA